MKKKFALAMVLGLTLVTVLSGCSKKDSQKDTESDINPTDYITLGEYKGLEVEVPSVEVTEADIQDKIDAFLLEKGTTETITDRPIQTGDIANIDYVGYMDGEAFENGSDEGFPLEIGSGSFIPGFEDGLIGVNSGETVDVELNFPDPYPLNPDFAGKPAVFNVKVNEVTKVIPADLTDDFVKENTDYDTVDAYRESVKLKLEADNIAAAQTEFETAVWRKAVDNASIISYPQDMIDRYTKIYQNQYETYASYYSMSLEEFVTASGGSMDEYAEMIKEVAERATKEELTVEAIIKAENISLTDKEYEAKYQEYADQYGYESIADLMAAYTEEVVKDNVIWEEAIKFVIDNAVKL